MHGDVFFAVVVVFAIVGVHDNVRVEPYQIRIVKSCGILHSQRQRGRKRSEVPQLSGAETRFVETKSITATTGCQGVESGTLF